MSETETIAPSDAMRYAQYLPSPVGLLRIVWQGDQVIHLSWEADPDRAVEAKENEIPPPAARLASELEAFFAGQRPAFSVSLAPEGTAFQQKVWQALLAIPAGQTRSYGALATELATSPRAIGGACGANPIPLLIPCHRVVTTDGRLGGFSGAGGTETKQRLLDLERHNWPSGSSPGALSLL